MVCHDGKSWGWDVKWGPPDCVHMIATCSTGHILLKYDMNVMPWEATLISHNLISVISNKDMLMHAVRMTVALLPKFIHYINQVVLQLLFLSELSYDNINTVSSNLSCILRSVIMVRVLVLHRYLGICSSVIWHYITGWWVYDIFRQHGCWNIPKYILILEDESTNCLKTQGNQLPIDTVSYLRTYASMKAG
jgi:hypothetical protein